MQKPWEEVGTSKSSERRAAVVDMAASETGNSRRRRGDVRDMGEQLGKKREADGNAGSG